MVPRQLLLKTTRVTHVELDTELDVYSVSTCGKEREREGEERGKREGEY